MKRSTAATSALGSLQDAALRSRVLDLVDAFEDLRAEGDDDALTRARAKVLDAIVVHIGPASTARDTHEAAGGRRP